jgi:hypothetical protein
MKTLFVCLFVMCIGLAAQAADVEVTNYTELKAACSAGLPGETITLRGGTDTFVDYIFPRGTTTQCNPGSSWELPVTVRLFPGEKVRWLRGDSTTGEGATVFRLSPDGVFDNPRYIRLIGGEMPETPDPNDRAWVIEGFRIVGNGSDIQFIGIEVRNCKCTSALPSGNYIDLINMSVHHNGTEGTMHGLYSHGSYNRVLGGYWAHNSGYSLHYYNNKDSEADGLCVPGMVTDANPKGCGIIGNVVQGVVMEASGLIFYQGADNEASNNEFRLARPNDLMLNANSLRTKILHNTAYEARLRLGKGCDDCVFQNNLMLKSSPTATALTVDPEATGLVESHNLTVDLSTEPSPVVDAAGGDYHLVPGSAAVDAGTPVAVAEDFDGVARPQGLAPDVGAYELIVDPPQAPVQNSIVLLCDERLQLSWSAAEGADGYLVHVKKRSAATWREPVDVGNVLEHVYATNLARGATYDVQISAYNTAGEGPRSNLKSKTAYDNPCP